MQIEITVNKIKYGNKYILKYIYYHAIKTNL